MDPTARFAECIARDPVPLDRVSLAIAAHAHVELDVDTEIARFDELATRVEAGSPAALCRSLFAPTGFTGNADDYYDPENSFVDSVLDRRVGIPITLSIIAIEVGRRVGVEMVGVGMPGHFLLRGADDPDLFFDTFDEGRELRTAEVEALFRRVHGSTQAFDERLLAVTPTIEIVRRVLANLMAIYVDNGTLHHLAWVLRLRTLLGGTDLREFRQLASVLTRLGRYGEAAAEYDRLALLDPDRSEEHDRAALRLRAASN